MRFSIVVPVYNGEKYLPSCLETVAGQTFGDYELVIVDDGSTNGSPAPSPMGMLPDVGESVSCTARTKVFFLQEEKDCLTVGASMWYSLTPMTRFVPTRWRPSRAVSTRPAPTSCPSGSRAERTSPRRMISPSCPKVFTAAETIGCSRRLSVPASPTTCGVKLIRLCRIDVDKDLWGVREAHACGGPSPAASYS